MVPEALARTKESLPRDLQVQSQGEAVNPDWRALQEESFCSVSPKGCDTASHTERNGEWCGPVPLSA